MLNWYVQRYNKSHGFLDLIIYSSLIFVQIEKQYNIEWIQLKRTKPLFKEL